LKGGRGWRLEVGARSGRVRTAKGRREHELEQTQGRLPERRRSHARKRGIGDEPPRRAALLFRLKGQFYGPCLQRWACPTILSPTTIWSVFGEGGGRRPNDSFSDRLGREDLRPPQPRDQAGGRLGGATRIEAHITRRDLGRSTFAPWTTTTRAVENANVTHSSTMYSSTTKGEMSQRG